MLGEQWVTILTNHPVLQNHLSYCYRAAALQSEGQTRNNQP